MKRVLYWPTPCRTAEEREASTLKYAEQFESFTCNGKSIFSNEKNILPWDQSQYELLDRKSQYMDRPKYFEEYFVPPKRKTQERPPLWYPQVRLEPYTFEDDLDPLLNIILEDDEVLKFLKGSRFILLLLTLDRS